ncbi:M28 family peptidase [Winogradskyella sp. UBA3174]|uniref:M28 family peptidase n=1 Tax=Winogradskyella sp. UBA3174 TaxID=1947785 RepID=UPI0025D9172D|nr:M28 family peptidase [Winogradskyella sp. UBA3174]|tara:strand:+ start:53518 stop:55092 length:1575 start_codon:yes stop_codon:yes gene_type:complete
MKKLLLTFFVSGLILSCGTSSKSNTSSTKQIETVNPADYAASITSEELKEMLYKFASDEFEGRETGEKGEKMAIEYLKEQYKLLAIPTPLGGDNYFQEVPLEKQKTAQAQLSVNGKSFNSFEDHIVLAISNTIDMSVNDIVYVGYGIDADNYSDYSDVDVKGKVVLAKAGEPKDETGNYITTGKPEDTKWTNGRQSLSSKRDAAKDKGAKGFILMDNTLFSRYSPFFKRQAESGASGRLSLKSNEEGMMMLMINENLGKALHGSILEDDTTKVLNSKLDVAIENKSESIISKNVVAYIKGSEKPDEIIVISAHLDHEGIKDGEVYNGADDDGSGTIAILEIAEAFKIAEKAGHGPKRSVLFLHVTGEEKGLLGSKHYTDNDPIFPLANTVADLNIDMIGRTDPERKEGDRNYIYLIGSDKLSTDLHKISEEVNSKYTNIELDYTYNDENDPNRFYYRSDHYNFAKNNIPVIFYFNGTHADYHKASDTADKIEYDLLENRTRLVFHTAWEVANRADRIVVDKATK